MLGYFIIFTIVGFVIGSINRYNSQSQSITIIAFISVIWGLSTAIIWGLVSFGEMVLGYFIFNLTYSNKANSLNTTTLNKSVTMNKNDDDLDDLDTTNNILDANLDNSWEAMKAKIDTIEKSRKKSINSKKT